MKLVDFCIICGNRDLKKHNAIVVPFVAERVGQKRSFHTRLLTCRDCGLKFFEIRWDDEELGRLYSGYREESYVRQRNKNEPWYTHKLNDDLVGNAGSWDQRRKILVRTLSRYEPGIEARVKSVLDFGGHRGQLIDGIFDGARKYVYEISNIETLRGIQRVDHPSADSYDLIVCSNVLEHVPYPRDCVQRIHNMVSKGGALYLDVPKEQPYSFLTLAKRSAQQVLLAVVRPKLFWTTLNRGMLTHMHEHINYFSAESIEHLLRNCGFSDIRVHTTCSQTGVICALARK